LPSLQLTHAINKAKVRTLVAGLGAAHDLRAAIRLPLEEAARQDQEQRKAEEFRPDRIEESDEFEELLKGTFGPKPARPKSSTWFTPTLGSGLRFGPMARETAKLALVALVALLSAFWFVKLSFAPGPPTDWTILPSLLWPLVAIIAIVAVTLIAWKAISSGSNVTIQWKVTEKVSGRVVITKVRERVPRPRKAARATT